MTYKQGREQRFDLYYRGEGRGTVASMLVDTEDRCDRFALALLALSIGTPWEDATRHLNAHDWLRLRRLDEEVDAVKI